MLKKLLLCTALLGAACSFATPGVSDEAVRIFGSEEAKERVSRGALFIDGVFVRGPYSITREGNVILVNGRIANRFKVAAKTAEPEPEPAEAEPETGDDAAEEIGESDEMPSLEESDYAAPAAETRQTSTIEKKLAARGGGIEARLAAKKRKQDLKASSSGSFNTGSSYDPEALFEEADYTYTPPSKPEPKAVPYIRPEAQLSAKERAAKAKAKDAEMMARSAGNADADSDADTGSNTVDSKTDAVADAADETFEGLSDKEIAAYTKRFAARRAAIENTLKANGLVLLVSTTDSVKAEKPSIMWRFIPDLAELCEADSSARLIAKWEKVIPRAYLQLMYDNRKENDAAMKTLLLRVKRESKAARERSRNRI